MKQILILTTLIFSFGLAQVPDEIQIQGIPGVDLCTLFTVEELNEITGLSLTQEFDHWPSNGLFYGTIFIPERVGPSIVDLAWEDGVAGVGEDPMNGKWCDYKGNGDRINLTAYDDMAHALSYTGRTLLEEAPDIYSSNVHCYIEPVGLFPVVIEVSASSRTLEIDRVEMACKIIIDGNIRLKSLAMAEEASE